MKTTYQKNFYNDIGLRFAHKVFGLKYLHYGYFDGLPTTLEALPKAQEAYVQKVLEQLPSGIQNVLDVGCGAGGVAQQLLARGLKVTCVDPDPFMLQKTSEATNNQIKTHNDFYENAEGLPEKSFDLVLMSESCQYVPVQQGFRQHRRFLKSGGYLLVSDFFKIREMDEPHLSKSGHILEDFLQEAGKHGFEVLANIDITAPTAPTHDIYQDILSNRAMPVVEAIVEYAQRRHPRIYKILAFFLRNRVEFLKLKYSSQGSDIFKKYKSYRIFLFQLKG